MLRQWEKTIVSPAVTGGQKVIVECPCPPRCQIEKLIVRQITGTPVNFECDLFSSKQKAQEFVAGIDDFNRVIPKQVSDSPGKMAKFIDITTAGRFENRDGGAADKKYKAYLVISPTGSEAGLTFEVTLGVLIEKN